VEECVRAFHYVGLFAFLRLHTRSTGEMKDGSMKTHNASIYHCVTCGRVEHVELKAKPPQCCGHKMAKAATETIREGDVAGKTASGLPQSPPPVIKRGTKPR
jgi:hypothetical protein